MSSAAQRPDVPFFTSMDYESFLASGVEEERERPGDVRQAFVAGLACMSEVVAAAALIVISVLGAFAAGLKITGVGLAAARFIHAVIVRLLLLLTVTRLLDERARWTPSRHTRTAVPAGSSAVA